MLASTKNDCDIAASISFVQFVCLFNWCGVAIASVRFERCAVLEAKTVQIRTPNAVAAGTNSNTASPHPFATSYVGIRAKYSPPRSRAHTNEITLLGCEHYFHDYYIFVVQLKVLLHRFSRHTFSPSSQFRLAATHTRISYSSLRMVRVK